MNDKVETLVIPRFREEGLIHMSTPECREPKPAAVLCMAFNRPDLFESVITALGKRGAAGRELFISIDGPREGRPDDVALCEQVLKLAEKIEWAGKIHLKAEQRNLGCGPAVSSAISWALSKVSEIIIIEDDCLPDPSFLLLCDELLERYRDDKRVMQIGGTNWGASSKRYAGYSYAFTSFAPIWGWATWRRAWELYDYELASWPRVKSIGLTEGMSISPRFLRMLERDWLMVRAGHGTWDHQWQYALLRHHGLSVCPERNLVKNIGFREDGSQLMGRDRIFSVLPLEELEFPLRHPPEVARSASVESVFEQIYWQKLGWPSRAFRWLVRSPWLSGVIRRAWRNLLPRPS
jgi:hypothetical protein